MAIESHETDIELVCDRAPTIPFGSQCSDLVDVHNTPRSAELLSFPFVFQTLYCVLTPGRVSMG